MPGSAASSGNPNFGGGTSSGSNKAGKRPAHPVTAQIDRATMFPAGTVLEQSPCFRDPPGIAGGSSEISLDYVLSAEGKPMSRFGCKYVMTEFLQPFMRTRAPLEIWAFQELAGEVKHGAVGSAAYEVNAAQRSIVRSAIAASLPLLREVNGPVAIPSPPHVVNATPVPVGPASTGGDEQPTRKRQMYPARSG